MARAYYCREDGLTPQGCGKASRFSCLFHGWTYDNEGMLKGIAKQSQFGELERSTRGLTELPCEERDGVIIGILTPGERLNVDEWLGFTPGKILKSLDLEKAHYVGERRLKGPNWKLCAEGANENYHLRTLHPYWKTVFVPDVYYAQQLGHHMLQAVCSPNIRELLNQPEDQWDTEVHISPGLFLFPSTTINKTYKNGAYGDFKGRFIISSRNLPGVAPDDSTYVLSVLSTVPLQTAEEIALGDKILDTLLDVNKEDVSVLRGIEAALSSGANQEVVFGRNELACQYIHRSLSKLLGRDEQ